MTESYKKYESYLLDEIDRQPKDKVTFENGVLKIESAIIEEEKYDVDEKICSISLDEITKPVVTIAGQLYNRPAIETWFKNNDTDPLTGMWVGTYKYLIPVPPDVFGDQKQLSQFKKNMRMNTLMWAPTYRYLQKAKKIAPLISEFKNKQFEGEEKKQWIAHQKKLATLARLYNKNGEKYPEYKKELSSDPHFDGSCTCIEYASIEKSYIPLQTCVEREYRDKINHPIFICHRFIDLSKVAFVGRLFKSCIFDGANLSGAVFMNCDMSRCSFIGTDLRETRFIRCQMIGEEVMFVGSIVDKKTMFVGCSIEYMNVWDTPTEKEEIIKVLKARGMDEADLIVVD